MHSIETLRSIAGNLRRLSEDADDELAAQLQNLAAEYDRMVGHAERRDLPREALWKTGAA